VQEEEIAEVEMLLEAYFMHVDNTYNRLQTLNEYIQDTEDLVNLKLDQHRNQLIGIDLVLTAFSSSLAIMTAVAGYFGMNLTNNLEEAEGIFRYVTIFTTTGAVTFFLVFIGVVWYRRLLIF
jgi:magnesium transporter